MRKLTSGIVGFLLLTFGVVAPGFADENELTALKEQIEKLNKRIADLESQVERPTNIVPAGAPSGTFVEGALSGIRLSGFVDTAFHWNFNNPTTTTAAAGSREQALRVFDQDEGSFTLHAVELSFEKPAPEDGGVGFRTDFFYGEDAEVITPTGSTTDEFDLQQAYVEARLPLKMFEGNEVLGDSLYLRAGRYVTLAGAEVIEAKDNWNTTRSIMFGWAIPFAHNGVRAVYDLWGGKVTTTVGLNNGWDLMEDNNNFSTFESQIAYKPNDDFLFTTTWYSGPENANQDGHKRNLLDFVALWNATDKLSLMGNIDIGRENRVINAAMNATGAAEDAIWHGYAAYARYQATDKLAFAGRLELFVDRDSYRLNPGGASGAIPATNPVDSRYWEWTSTTEYKLYDNLVSRLEYRYDWSDGTIFNGESSQQTLSAQLIYNFA